MVVALFDFAESTELRLLAEISIKVIILDVLILWLKALGTAIHHASMMFADEALCCTVVRNASGIGLGPRALVLLSTVRSVMVLVFRSSGRGSETWRCRASP